MGNAFVLPFSPYGSASLDSLLFKFPLIGLGDEDPSGALFILRMDGEAAVPDDIGVDPVLDDDPAIDDEPIEASEEGAGDCDDDDEPSVSSKDVVVEEGRSSTVFPKLPVTTEAVEGWHPVRSTGS